MAGDDRKSRRKQRREAAESSSVIPTNVVCTSQALATSKNSIELGLVFSLCVVGLYLYGFWEELHAIPSVSTGRRWGANLNMANMEYDSASVSAGISSLGGALPASAHVSVPVPEPAPVVVGGAGGGTEQERRRDVVVDAALTTTTHKNNGVDGSNAYLNIPEGKWPVTLQDEPNNVELLIHPGDGTTEMYLPKFWSLPLHNKQHFSREQAMQIGTCVQPDPVTGSHTRGDACPMKARTIFIAIASYRDFECRSTLESAFGAATHPERIRVGKLLLLFVLLLVRVKVNQARFFYLLYLILFCFCSFIVLYCI